MGRHEIDLTGFRHEGSRLVAIERADVVTRSGHGAERRWRCRCDCGKEAIVEGRLLRGGNTKSCGCLVVERGRAIAKEWHRRSGHKTAQQRVGETHGRLTILRLAERCVTSTTWIVECQCACGNRHFAHLSNVTSGKTISCGCAMGGKPTHGLSKHPLYMAWMSIQKSIRCTVCEGWSGRPEHGLLAFARDMGDRPAGHELIRLNIADGFWCGRCSQCVALSRKMNCKWSPQDRRRIWAHSRMSRTIMVDGVERTVRDLCRENGISRQVLSLRINRRGWTLERAATTPLQHTYSRVSKTTRKHRIEVARMGGSAARIARAVSPYKDKT